MTENNVIEFCQWLMNEKGIEAGNLSDYINNNEEDVLKLAEEFKKPKFKIGGKIESAAEMFKCGGKTKKRVKKGEFGMTAPQKTVTHSRGKDSLHTMPGKNNTIDSIGFIKPQDPRIKGGEYSVKKDGATGVYSGFYDNIFGDYRQLSAEEARRLFRDLVNRINSVPQKQDGGELLRRKDLKKEAKENYGYNGKQFRDAYRNSIAAYQNKGYNRHKAKEFAQEILTRAQEKPAVPALVLSDIGSPINAKISAPSDINMPINKFSTIIAGNFSNTSDYDSMSFNSAFGAARKSGDKTFWWRGKEYGTELAKDNRPKAAKVGFNKVELEPMDINIVPVRKINEKPATMFDSEGLPIGYEIPGGYNDIESFKFFNYPDSTIVTKDHDTRYRLHKSGDNWVGFEGVSPDSLVYSNIDDENKVDSLLRRYRAVTNRIIDKNKVF